MSITLKGIYSDQPSFRSIKFDAGFNIVMAERIEESTDKDSRNGLGKSTMIELIHYCLGAKPNSKLKQYLNEWEFSLDLLIDNNNVLVSRDFSSPSVIFIDGNTEGLPIQPHRKGTRLAYSAKEWNLLLGHKTFGLPFLPSEKYSPTFRSLISYFIRRGRDAFSNAFEHHRKQRQWEKQVNNSFLLNLAWEDAREWQLLKDKTRRLNDLKKAVKSGDISEIFGSPGELQASKVRLERQIQSRESELKNYQVHLQYEEIQRNADSLTANIHDLTNENVSDKRLLKFYLENIKSQVDKAPDDILELYQLVNITLPGMVRKRLQDAQDFHNKIVSNRRDFLSSEVEKIQKNIKGRTQKINQLSRERSQWMEILSTHGALDEYTKLQQLLLKEIEELNKINTRINTLREFEDVKIEHRLQEDLLVQRARRDYLERQIQREKAISIFNENSEALYSAPGSLVIDIGDKGFVFDVDIERSDSEGVSSMKIFCYDLMLAQLWSEAESSPNILIHDSTLFEGVDERQIARALELAARKSEEFGFQYICTMNSDRMPDNDFSESFDYEGSVRMTLTDATEDGSLLGIRF